jgi:hypothetical protein
MIVRKHGEDYDWWGASTIDTEVVHSIGGKAHGWYEIVKLFFNKIKIMTEYLIFLFKGILCLPVWSIRWSCDLMGSLCRIWLVVAVVVSTRAWRRLWGSNEKGFVKSYDRTKWYSSTTIKVHGCLQHTCTTSNERECLIYSQDGQIFGL